MIQRLPSDPPGPYEGIVGVEADAFVDDDSAS
jgi:hypothetical protein